MTIRIEQCVDIAVAPSVLWAAIDDINHTDTLHRLREPRLHHPPPLPGRAWHQRPEELQLGRAAHEADGAAAVLHERRRGRGRLDDGAVGSDVDAGGDVPRAERLGPADAAALQALVEQCADYYTLVEGAPAGPHEAEKLLAEANDAKGSQRELEKDVRRFERRGERETKLARTRVERLVRRNRRAFEREANRVEHKADRRDNVVTERLAAVSKAAAEGVTAVSNRVEETVQVGVATGERIATRAKGVSA